MAKPKRDPVRDLKEWNDHIFNPYYWVNRYTPFHFPRRSRSAWQLEGIQFLLFAITAFFLLTIVLGAEEQPTRGIALILLIAIGAFALIQWQRMEATKPLRDDDEEAGSQGEASQPKRIHPKKKKLPRRRKDYK